jgi:hypothetical protein
MLASGKPIRRGASVIASRKVAGWLCAALTLAQVLHSADNTASDKSVQPFLAKNCLACHDAGRHLAYPDTPMTNLYLTVLDRMGVPAEKLGDSNGKVERLSDV